MEYLQHYFVVYKLFSNSETLTCNDWPTVAYGCGPVGGDWKYLGNSATSQSDCLNLCASELSTGCCLHDSTSSTPCYFKEGSAAGPMDDPTSTYRAIDCTQCNIYFFIWKLFLRFSFQDIILFMNTDEIPPASSFLLVGKTISSKLNIQTVLKKQ